jgi:anti-sigma regulatory factor (Ser/Thr protein kinase)
VQHDGLRHEAFAYADEREFLAGAAAFIHAGVSAGQPILVAVDAAKTAALRTLVDDGHDIVEYADMAALGRNPARVIPLLQGFIDQHNTTSAGLRGICETVWADRRPEELVECRRSELLLNEAFSDAAGFWVLCPYDSSTLERIVIDDAYLTHPFIDGAGESHARGRYQSHQVAALLDEPLPEPPAAAVVVDFSAADLALVRRLATQHAVAAGLGERATDLALAADELATNSVRHSGGEGVLRLWRQDRALVIEVSDQGHLDDRLVGRRRPARSQFGGRGLWLVNQLSDLVQLRSSTSGTTARAHFWGDGA